MGEIEISEYVAGSIGRMIELHGSYYRQNWNLGRYFEASVAAGIGKFYLNFNSALDGAWFALDGTSIVGGIFIVGTGEPAGEARLRWFIIDPAYQGTGIGHRLMNQAMTFCRDRGFGRIYLTTFPGLDAARHLYELHGFQLAAEADGAHLTGSKELVEHMYEYRPG